LLHQGFKHDGFMALSDREQESDGFASSFAAEMNFAAEAALTITQGFILSAATASASGVLMSPNHAAIDKVECSAKLTSAIGLLLQLLQNLLPESSFAPRIKSPRHRFLCPVSIR
jgi:hypothetical protein